MYITEVKTESKHSIAQVNPGASESSVRLFYLGAVGLQHCLPSVHVFSLTGGAENECYLQHAHDTHSKNNPFKLVVYMSPYKVLH